jgi:hypothetical protein
MPACRRKAVNRSAVAWDGTSVIADMVRYGVRQEP